jgi:hypothetical protein
MKKFAGKPTQIYDTTRRPFRRAPSACQSMALLTGSIGCASDHGDCCSPASIAGEFYIESCLFLTMSSAANLFAKQLNEYFNGDDFIPVQAAGKKINAALRDDEAAPDADLHRRIAASDAGVHLYFPDRGDPIMQWKHVRSDPLPPRLVQELSAVQSNSLMGLLTPASLAWMSVDHKLFLWSISHRDAPVSCFEVPSRQCVVSVGLVKPKMGTSDDT